MHALLGATKPLTERATHVVLSKFPFRRALVALVQHPERNREQAEEDSLQRKPMRRAARRLENEH